MSNIELDTQISTVDLRRPEAARTAPAAPSPARQPGSRELPSESLSRSIIGAAIEVHRNIGRGLLEALYERAMCVELGLRGISFESQVAIPMRYKDSHIGSYYADLIVDGQIIVELKSTSALNNAHVAQVLTYLKITDLRLALLINFDVPVLHQGVKRVIR